jgi:hypothetical protein
MPEVYGLTRVQLLSVHSQQLAVVLVDRLIIFFLRSRLVQPVMFFLLTAQIRYFIGPNLLVHKDRKVLRAPKVLKAQLVPKAQLDHKVLKALKVHKVQLH